MPNLVALDLGGQAFVDALRGVWDRGDAAFPIDGRLPAAARDRLLEAMAPSSVIGPQGESPLQGGRPVEDGDALVIATSGSSGEPKGVVLTDEALAAHAQAVHRRLRADRSTDRWLACLPLSHMGGLGVVIRAMFEGMGLDVLDHFDAETVAKAPEALGSTLVSLVPTALDRLPDPHGYRWVILGGSADTASRPRSVINTYGLTETGGGIYYSTGGLLDGAELRITDGEIEVAGPTLLRCYRDGTDPRGPDGWLATGDLGEWDADGSLVVLGRRGDLIITGGENVWPGTVEPVLAADPAVADVAVAGRPDPEWGERVVAFVVPTNPSAPPTLDQLRALAAESLPAFAAPRELVLVEEIPRTALGKPRRDQL